MAVPTLSSITPAAGTPTGGQVIAIVGTNFRLPTPPGAAIPVPAAPPPVRVLFGATPSPDVAVVSSTRLLVRVPKRALPVVGPNTLASELVDVTVENIDDSGVLIPGETVTADDAYEYIRPPIAVNLAGKYGVTRVTETLVDLLRSECLANTMPETGTDYDPNTSTIKIESARTPQLVVTGPDLEFNAFFTFRGAYLVPGPQALEGFRRRRHRVVDLNYEIVGVTNDSIQLNNLIEVLALVVERNPTLRFELTPGQGDFIDLEMRWTSDPSYERQGADPGLISDLRVFRGALQLRGYPLRQFPGVDQDAIQEVGFEVDITTLEAPTQIGDNLPDTQGAPTRSPPDSGV